MRHAAESTLSRAHRNPSQCCQLKTVGTTLIAYYELATLIPASRSTGTSLTDCDYRKCLPQIPMLSLAPTGKKKVISVDSRDKNNKGISIAEKIIVGFCKVRVSVSSSIIIVKYLYVLNILHPFRSTNTNTCTCCTDCTDHTNYSPCLLAGTRGPSKAARATDQVAAYTSYSSL